MPTTVPGRVEEPFELVGGTHPIGPAAFQLHFGGVGGLGRIVSEQPAADGVIGLSPKTVIDVHVIVQAVLYLPGAGVAMSNRRP